jgi:hypothetical protein
MMSVPDRNKRQKLIPAPVIRWLILIALSFVIGGVTIALAPSLSSGVLNVGIVTNVLLAIGMGIFLGWRMALSDLPVAIVAGAVVTVVGVDSLFVGLIILDAIAFVVAVIGMSILLVAGATVGTVARGLHSGCRCLQNRPRHGVRLRSVWSREIGSGQAFGLEALAGVALNLEMSSNPPR